MNISTLILAAEYLDRRQTESEHGYSISAQVPVFTRSRKPRSGKSKAARSTHNESEKNRRAHLRHCFDELKRVVPLSRDSSHHTTLGLLKQACHFIKEIEECHRKKQHCLRELIQEHDRLLDQQQLLGDGEVYRQGNHVLGGSSSCSPVSSRSFAFSERDDNTSDDYDCVSGEGDFECNMSISLR